jgi:hypothetical protein
MQNASSAREMARVIAALERAVVKIAHPYKRESIERSLVFWHTAVCEISPQERSEDLAEFGYSPKGAGGAPSP